MFRCRRDWPSTTDSDALQRVSSGNLRTASALSVSSLPENPRIQQVVGQALLHTSAWPETIRLSLFPHPLLSTPECAGPPTTRRRSVSRADTGTPIPFHYISRKPYTHPDPKLLRSFPPSLGLLQQKTALYPSTHEYEYSHLVRV